MRTLVHGLLLPAILAVGCGDPPTTTVRFTPLGNPDNCAASEESIVTGSSAVWVGLRDADVTVAARCLPLVDAARWQDVEDELVGADLLIEELPFDTELDLFVMGIPGTCPPADPVGAVRFCGRSESPLLIREGRGDGTALVRRICPATYSAQDCFGGS